MSEVNSAWPFGELASEEGLDIDKIFGSASTGTQSNLFDAVQEQPSAPAPVQVEAPTVSAVTPPATAPQQNVSIPTSSSASSQPSAGAKTESMESNPIAAAFEKKTVENAKKGLLEKLPVFQHRNAKETIQDPSITFEELRIQKCEDFTDLESSKHVSWYVVYCGIRKEIKDPKGTTIISVKEMIERSREFLDALKKAKNKDPDCLVKPMITGGNKGIAAYRGNFRTLEEARESDKVICLLPSNDGRFYELRKTEQGEFIAPIHKVKEFQEIRAGFLPALPLVPRSLMGKIIAFFRSVMLEDEYEALAIIYWDKVEREFLVYVPKQKVTKEHITSDQRECPYSDEERYIRYADIHSHNSMEAEFSPVDDQDERATGLYLVMGMLDRFYPDIQARFFCGGTFIPLDPAEVIEGLDQDYPKEWNQNVTFLECSPQHKKKEVTSFPCEVAL